MEKQKIFSGAKFVFMFMMIICVAFTFVACVDNDDDFETQAQMQTKFETAHATTLAYKGSSTITTLFDLDFRNTDDVLNQYTFNSITNEVAHIRTTNPDSTTPYVESEYIVFNDSSTLVLYDSKQQPMAYYVSENYVQKTYGITYRMDDGDTTRNFFDLIAQLENETSKYAETRYSYSKAYIKKDGKYTLRISYELVDELTNSKVKTTYSVGFGNKIETVNVTRVQTNESTKATKTVTYDYKISYSYDKSLMQKTIQGFNTPQSSETYQ